MCLYPLRLKAEDGFETLVRCGQCFKCRLRRKLAWVGRLRLEAQCHRASRFLTLTYSPKNYPGDVLLPEHLVDFMKRYRYHYGRCRFFGVGELGGKNNRAHWHVLIFGHPPVTDKIWKDEKAWLLGGVGDGTVTKDSVGYVADYTLKGEKDAAKRPVVRMSLRPGIGFTRIAQMALAAPRDLEAWPGSYRIGNKSYPLCDGGLAKFQTVYLESGGMPPRVLHPVSRDLVSRAYVASGGSAFDHDVANRRMDYEVDEFKTKKTP